MIPGWNHILETNATHPSSCDRVFLQAVVIYHGRRQSERTARKLQCKETPTKEREGERENHSKLICYRIHGQLIDIREGNENKVQSVRK